MTNSRRVPIALPSVGEEEWHAIREPLESGWLTQGPKVAEFEAAFAARHEVAYALATTSCTTALQLSLLALGIGPGDEVIVPSFTWVASANVVLHVGAKPVLVDIEEGTFNIDPKVVEQHIRPATKAVMAVHMFGLVADVAGIRELLSNDIAIIEDAACAVGAAGSEGRAGSLGEIAAFSFHPRKTITTGEGGMVTTSDPALAERINRLRNHGASVSEEIRHQGPKPYLLPDFDDVGFNYRMTDIQAAVGIEQLKKLDRLLREREDLARFYREELAEVSWLRTPTIPEEGQHGWQAFVCYVDPDTAPMSRNEMMEVLEAKGISTRPGTHALHTLGVYRDRFGFDPHDLPVSYRCAEQTLALPLHNRMAPDDAAFVVSAIGNLEDQVSTRNRRSRR